MNVLSYFHIVHLKSFAIAMLFVLVWQTFLCKHCVTDMADNHMISSNHTFFHTL